MVLRVGFPHPRKTVFALIAFQMRKAIQLVASLLCSKAL